jgi:hypothetical protein
MKVSPLNNTAWRVDHPMGTVSFNYLIEGGAGRDAGQLPVHP